MDTLSRLNALPGKTGILKTTDGEVRFTCIAVHSPDKLLLTGTNDDELFHSAVNQSEFTIQIEEGSSIDGSSTQRIPGIYIATIDD